MEWRIKPLNGGNMFNSNNMPISLYASAFSRHLINTLNGNAMLMHVLVYRPARAEYYDLDSRRYIQYVGLMDNQGYCQIGFISRDSIEPESVRYPNIIKLSDLTFSAKVGEGRKESYNQRKQATSMSSKSDNHRGYL